MSAEVKRVIIMRGVPGSGKSTAARMLASGGREGEFWLEDKVTYFGSPEHFGDEHIEAERLTAIHSTDQYFVNKAGEYRFSPKRLWPNHNANYKAFRNSVDDDIPLVIVDNTNTQRKEWKKYQDYAEDAGYWVSFHVMPHPSPKVAAARNTHGVPLDKIEQMIARFE
jgi:tRNA uridine 5-carbamoylmethylation protein Kti12